MKDIENTHCGLSDARLAALRDPKFADSLLEETGFELLVPLTTETPIGIAF